mgnify:CR=1 FL=1
MFHRQSEQTQVLISDLAMQEHRQIRVEALGRVRFALEKCAQLRELMPCICEIFLSASLQPYVWRLWPL